MSTASCPRTYRYQPSFRTSDKIDVSGGHALLRICVARLVEGRLGIRLSDQLVVTGVDSPDAWAAGWRSGDVILKASGERVRDAHALRRLLSSAWPPMDFEVVRLSGSCVAGPPRARPVGGPSSAGYSSRAHGRQEELAVARRRLEEAREVRRQLHAKLLARTLRETSIIGLLQTQRGASMTMKASAAQVSGDSSQRQIGAFMELVDKLWTAKGHNLLHELCTNLRQPSEQIGAAAGAEPLGLRVLAEVCEQVQKHCGHKPLNANLQGYLLAVCTWVVYTMQDVDVDRLLQFADCPILPEGMEEPAQRDLFYKEYRARCGGNRNPQMFAAANWAARVCFDKGGDESSQAGKASLAGVRTWVKWLCFLGASAKELEDPVTVTRGLCGLPDFLVDQFRSKRAGDILFWAAPSSTTEDASISESYCNQELPRERNVLFTISGVNQAFPMYELSHYPKEREWLLPPFCKLEVERVIDASPLQVHCRFAGCLLGADLRERVLRDFREGSDTLSSVQEKMRSELAAMHQELADAKSVAQELGAPEVEAEVEKQRIREQQEEEEDKAVEKLTIAIRAKDIVSLENAIAHCEAMKFESPELTEARDALGQQRQFTAWLNGLKKGTADRNKAKLCECLDEASERNLAALPEVVQAQMVYAGIVVDEAMVPPQKAVDLREALDGAAKVGLTDNSVDKAREALRAVEARDKELEDARQRVAQAVASRELDKVVDALKAGREVGLDSDELQELQALHAELEEKGDVYTGETDERARSALRARLEEDLLEQATKLRKVDVKESFYEPSSGDLDCVALLYTKAEGDLAKLAEATGSSAEIMRSKPPADALDFARKLLNGDYSGCSIDIARMYFRKQLLEGITAPKLRKAEMKEQSSGPSTQDIEAIARVYLEHRGNADSLAQAFGANVWLIRKRPPSHAVDFGKKLLEGVYTGDKIDLAKADLRDRLLQDLQDKAGTLSPTKANLKVGAVTPTDEEIECIAGIWRKHGGDLARVAEVTSATLGLLQQKPPADGKDFARRLLDGDYTGDAIEMTKASFRDRLMEDLLAGSQRLKPVERRSQAFLAVKAPDVEKMAEIYAFLDGDLPKIAEAVGISLQWLEHPKHRPKDAADFGQKLLEGFYCGDMLALTRQHWRNQLALDIQAKVGQLRKVEVKEHSKLTYEHDAAHVAHLADVYTCCCGEPGLLVETFGIDIELLEHQSKRPKDAEDFARKMLDGEYDFAKKLLQGLYTADDSHGAARSGHCGPR